MIDKETLREFIQDAITASEIVEQFNDLASEISLSAEGTVSYTAIKKEFLKTLKEFI